MTVGKVGLASGSAVAVVPGRMAGAVAVWMAPGRCSPPSTGASLAQPVATRTTLSATARMRTTPTVRGAAEIPPKNTRRGARLLFAPLYDRDRHATHAEAHVAPGGTGTFTFRLRAPAASATYRIDLRPVVEGITWLEDEGIHLLLTVG